MAIIAIDASRAARTNKTGVEWYSYYLIKEILKIPSEHKYILYTNKPLPREILSAAKVDYKEKVLSWPFKYFWTLIRLSLQIIIDRPNLLFVPAHNLPLSLPKNTLITWHDIGYRRWPSYYSWLQKLSLKIGEAGLKKTNLIITVSDFSKKEMIEVLKIKEDKIKVVPLAVDKSFCYPRETELQEKVSFKFNIKKPFLLFVGRLEEKKNLLKIIRAFNLFVSKSKSSCQLVLIGNPGFGYERIVEEISNSSYKNQILKLGWLSPEQLAAVFSASQGLVFPTNYEGFGMPVLEAHAYGKRAIISRGTAAAELSDSDDLLVDQNSETSIANAMINLLNESNRSEKGIDEKYTWPETARKTLEVIEGLLK